MPELRLNVVTNEWVIIAKERAKRPIDFSRPNIRPSVAAYVANCPFCPGNEALGADEIYRHEKADHSSWQCRSILNKYPALSADIAQVAKRQRGLQVSVDGFGFHEVIVDSPRHDLAMAQMSVEEVSIILQTYRARYLACRTDPRVVHVILFKNHGETAGSSLIHPHSQLIATPVVSNQIRDRLKVMGDHFSQHGGCLLCQMIEEEIAEAARIVYLSKHFVALVPYAALSSFHLWIFPLRHAASFGEILDAELADLALNLRTVLARLYYGLNDPDFNFVIRSAPQNCEKNEFHWYLSIVPRLSRAAGFELGSGMYINASLPEDSAAFLRDLPLPDAS